MPQKYSAPVYKRDVPWWAYDAALCLALALLLVAHLCVHGGIALRIVTGAALLVLVYGSFVEPHLLRVKRYAVGSGARVLKIAFLSDIHVGPFKGTRWVERLVRRTNALAPDLILLGGDYLYHDPGDAPKLAPLAGLKARHGVFAILGNHDEWQPGAPEAARAQFEKMGIPLLLNRAARFEHEGRGVTVAGVEDDWYADTDFAAAMAGVRPDDALVMMIHNPDLAEPASKFKPALMICGHVHGGQIRLPFLGPVPKLPHHLGRKYDRGLFDWKGVSLLIGAGAGESGPRARLFCPPEIVVAELRV